MNSNPIQAGKRWWRQLGWRHQDRLGNLIPLVAVLLFVMVMVSAFLFLRMEEREREEQGLVQQSQLVLQRLSDRLMDRQEQLQRLVSNLTTPAVGSGFDQAARQLLGQQPELQAVTWFDARQRVVSTHHAAMLPGPLRRMVGQVWRDVDLSAYPYGHWELVPGRYVTGEENVPPLLRLFTPIHVNDAYLGMIVAEYSPQAMLNAVLTGDNAAALAIALTSAGGDLVAAIGQAAYLPRWVASAPVDEWLAPPRLTQPVPPLDDALMLQTVMYRTDKSVTSYGWMLLLVLLGLTTIGMLLMNWRLSRRRYQAQGKLRAESHFRLAIENSLMAGIRVLDLSGKTTYANATFSRMVGWSVQELVGMTAPFPYWPREDREVLTARFQAELEGRHYPGGLQLRMLRKNGTTFDARVFLTPMFDDKGRQTGWLSTINDITEPNRIRQQLATAHDRFTLVLESLDASISVAPLGSKELLFANRLYRQWFGSQSTGHLKLLSQAGASELQESGDNNSDEEDGLMGLPTEVITSANPDRAEIYIERLDKWLEVRSRYLDWVDGRLAQMVIATDITKRKLAEEQAERQAEKMETVSRLMTMGEMASSVAHELNQPLAAISNYVGGMISRIQSGSIALEQLLPPLEKTAHQAVRAGQVIHRIRAFVKRSAPNRERCEPQRLVGEALELASIELRKRNVRLSSHIAPYLPKIEVDAILIEQVLINLLKNAAEAIDGADLPTGRRSIDLQVNRDDGGVRFAVTDQGPGLPEQATQQLFEAFYSTKTDGMGIGLNLCRSIVESHQGKMQVRNLYNEQGEASGCEFSFWLPVAASNGTSRGPEAPEESTNQPAR
ncbi:PAS domain-containing sensor histidine kinase [Corticibacter populi]|uniref:histidine kinase n=1 Tax=Corticibacter populi TaxID=1550736 RepID=A0A3M6QZ96_9BURK|nr:PAS domain-containing sensor histidine kinase [Corticibacter populi]RMX08261.1 PAS domain-containing sensor histidine kinase [Corticibacter populi]RZS35536.1 PAS/PAC sensor signal transduction histidine kinase [Corticibacter populi]